MPGLNGTGPLGLGPQTGRGLGYCSGTVNRPIYQSTYGYGYSPIFRGAGSGKRGLGRFGRGRGLARGVW
jgi:hypothetical protein